MMSATIPMCEFCSIDSIIPLAVLPLGAAVSRNFFHSFPNDFRDGQLG
jgi:hypothetical protein